jgi:uncharacterized protein (TIGR02246 family)
MTDHDEIRNLIGRYAHAADAQSADDYASLYVEDGSLTENGITVTPRERIRALVEYAGSLAAGQPQPSGTKHLQLNTVIDVHGDTASAVTDLVAVTLDPEQGFRIRGCGTYTDEIVRDHDGRWRFKSRTVTWFKNAGPDPLNPTFAHAMEQIFEHVMSEAPAASG